MTYISNKNFLFEVAKGNVPGHSVVNKFGAATIGTTLVPICVSNIYRMPTTATALEFLSSSANDTSAGTGARQITVEGLNSSWAAVSQTVTTNGTTAVALGTNLIRLYRWYVSQSGTYANSTTASHAGTLTIRESGGGTTWTTINTTNLPKGRSEIGFYTIPTGKTGYVFLQSISVDTTKAASMFFVQRASADTVSAPYSALMMVNKFIGVTGYMVLDSNPPLGPFVGPCDIGFMGKTTSGTADVEVKFDIVLVDN